MNVNFSIGQNNLFNAHRINQNIAKQNGNGSYEQFSKAERKDGVTISPQGKRNSLLKSLMEQKTRIIEQKNSLIGSTLEKYGSLDTIKLQLENYDEQMKNIDNQIAEMMAKEMEKQTEKLEKQNDSKPKTEEEIQNERLAGVVSLAGDLQQTKTISSVQSRAEGDARVLKSEIELDKMRAGSSPGAKEMIAKKESTLAGLEQKVMDLTSKVSDKLSDIVENIDYLNKPQEILPDNETESKMEELDSTNKLFSDIAKDEKSEKVLDEKTVSE